MFSPIKSIILMSLALALSLAFAETPPGSLDDKIIQQVNTVSGPLKMIPVQYNGRLQPFDTFTQDTLRFITGRSHFQKRAAISVVLSWILLPRHWDKISFIKVENLQLKGVLGLDSKSAYFSPTKLMSLSKFKSEIQDLESKRSRKEKLDDYYLELEKLESRLLIYQAIQRGQIPLWFADKEGWKSILEASPSQRAKWTQLFEAYSKATTSASSDLILELQEAVSFFTGQLDKIPLLRIQAEVQYNKLNLVRLSWLFYLLALFCFFLLYLKPKFQNKIFLSLLIIPFILHTYTIILRIFIMSRPPVTNMYETLLWVPWAALVLAAGLSCIRAYAIPIIVGTVAAAFSLFVADTAYEILDGRLLPLEAVLRSTFWLSTHVLIITMSYSSFLLAFIMGDFLLIQFFRGYKERDLKKEFWFLNKCLQVGVLLLAIGTILGGVWADYSWGRFWGWDPKEVWALVSLLGYLALLHARLQGWVKGFGLAISSILCFFLVIMAWYGVNFVLGAGLHSYGFGRGGLSYVLTFIGLHILFVFGAWRWKKWKQRP